MDSYNDFFTGSATIAGALVGLLFVALSVQPERNRDRHSIEHRAVAGTAFTALIDALFVSLIGLQPGAGLQYGAIIFGALGLISSCAMARRLYMAQRTIQLSRRWRTFMLFIISVYTAQLVVGLIPMDRSSKASFTAGFIYAMFSLGIARAWELLGMQTAQGGLVGQLHDALTHSHGHTPSAPSTSAPSTRSAPPALLDTPGPGEPPPAS